MNSSLASRLKRSGLWVLLGLGLSQALRFSSNLILTRLLMPEHFGLMAVATVAMVVIGLILDVGIRQALIRSPRAEDPAFLSTAFTLQILRALVIGVIGSSVALGLLALGRTDLFPPGSVYRSELLPGMVALMAWSMLPAGCNSPNLEMADRRLQIRQSTLIELTAQFSGLLSTALIAWSTRSPWSLVAGPWISASVTAILSHLILPGPKVRFGWDPVAAREILGNTRWILAATALSMLAMNFDRLFLGGAIDATLLGCYAIALSLYNVVEMIIQRLTGRISFPAFSEIQRERPQDLRRGLDRIQLPVDIGLGLIAGVFFHAAVPLVDLFYDDRYAAAGPMFSTLAIGLIGVRLNVTSGAFMARGRFDLLTHVQALNCVTLLLGLPQAFSWGGLPAALWALALHRLPSTFLVMAYARGLGIGRGLREWAVVPALAAGYLIGLVCCALVPVIG
ncbi:oligosaccharide flippase family protein [Aquariibacter albus]|uniref:Oligosaccharide flippase family protein n=1 Tax=Aquariibacter albus TaxID=2759899 RepID=A0A839HS68_9BURK|nr:oligosaccharide flippase family protein [Aquariibacter albus]MBB1162189.1 oligosaccharide flippase family protein [Aquariibacter albus]